MGENEAKRRAEQGHDQQTKAITGYKQRNIKDSESTHLVTSQELSITQIVAYETKRTLKEEQILNSNSKLKIES